MPAATEPVPLFRRPGPEDAIALARERFDAGESVDMRSVAARLGVSRATLHRWLGTRDALMAAVLDGLARDYVTTAEDEATGAGDERLLDFVRRLSAMSALHAPLREAVEREPGLALRLILAPERPVRLRVREAVRRLLASTRPPAALRALDDRIDTFVDAAMALQWATVVTGGDPDPERAVLLGRALLATAPASRPAVSRRPRRGSSGTG